MNKTVKNVKSIDLYNLKMTCHKINQLLSELKPLLIVKYGTEYRETYKGYEYLLTTEYEDIKVTLL